MHPLIIILLTILSVLPSWSAQAQSDSLGVLRRVQREAMAQADSLGDLTAGLDARMRLAALSGPGESLALLQQAAALADSLHRPDLGATVRRELARSHAALRQFAAAYAAVHAADSLDGLREQMDLAQADAERAAERTTWLAQQDSLVQAGALREAGMAQAMEELREKAERWMWTALGVGLAGLLLILWLLYRAGKTTSRLAGTLAALRQEVDALKARPVPAPTVTKEEVVAHAVDAAMKPVVAGLFRQAAPERLATLRDARQRGDTDKTLRVVASLKPQLLAFDAERFGPLITRLKAAGASDIPAQWSADLDALEQGVMEWAAHRADQ